MPLKPNRVVKINPDYEELCLFEKLKYTTKRVELYDGFLVYSEVVTIGFEGNGKIRRALKGKKSDGSIVNDNLGTEYFTIPLEDLDEFTRNVFKLMKNVKQWDEYCVDDRSERLELTCINDCMKLSLDRMVTDGNVTIGYLFDELMKKAEIIYPFE